MKKRWIVIGVIVLIVIAIFVCIGSCVAGGGSGGSTGKQLPTEISNDIESQLQEECTKWYQDKLYDFQIQKAEQGNVTEKIQAEGINGIWCIQGGGKCGNSPVTRDYVYIQQGGRWSKSAGGMYSPLDDYWVRMGCPFRMH